MKPHRPFAKPIDWRTTLKVRRALRDGRYVVSEHVEEKLPQLGLSRAEFLGAISTGVVLSRRERDEVRTATDGYKHFLEGVAANGSIIEVVLKFVRARAWPGEELMILITAYRGKV